MKPTVEHCRQILGKRAEGMTDDEVLQVRDALAAFANVLIDKYLSEQEQINSSCEA
jgi:hypothetical protein